MRKKLTFINSSILCALSISTCFGSGDNAASKSQQQLAQQTVVCLNNSRTIGLAMDVGHQAEIIKDVELLASLDAQIQELNQELNQMTEQEKTRDVASNAKSKVEKPNYVQYSRTFYNGTNKVVVDLGSRGSFSELADTIAVTDLDGNKITYGLQCHLF